MDLFPVFGNLFWDLLHHEIKSYFPGNKVAYVLVLKFVNVGKDNFFIKIEFNHF